MTGTEKRLEQLPAFLTAPATAKVLAALPCSRAVGGAVRDALAGLPVADVDVAAPLPPEEIIARLIAAGCKVFETGLAHGTVTAVWDHQPIEVTALRRDVLTDGRHAEVAWTTDWREDAARRDFTINAMSLGADGVLHDYFGGRDDLARGVVRFVGDPETRLAEDYLRLLRFFRFQARYGKGAPDAAALRAIRAAIPGLARLSVERIWMEIKRILMVAEPAPALQLMAELGVLPAILPEIAAPDIECVARLVAFGAPAEPLLRLAALGGAAPGLAARLKFSLAETRALRFLQEAEMPGAAVDAAEFRRWRARHAAVALETQEAALWLADAREGATPLRNALRATLHGEAAPVFPLQGRDLLAEGASPGPALGALLAKVEAYWIAGGCAADHAACLAEAKRLMARP
ncbi:MAG: CCA tRNA nucleotidyltransferase [Roseomonas sp.]|nr:CCA tRNA nucleotidyltransferase [Roseomonas sp.]MCA3425860.1 CCA tRNA nucleotidyltransferase [Roseomonas sp.]